MSKYVYPAVFTPDIDGGYDVVFPDIDGCLTCGYSLAEAMDYANDALALMLVYLEDEKRSIPEATPIDKVKHKKGTFVTYIACDTLDYRKKMRKRAVKKTLSIPEWLDHAATAAGINFSQTLQEALKEKLQLS